MKCFVRLPLPSQGMLFGLGGVLLVGVVEAKTVVSHLVVGGLAALLVRSEWMRRRREKDEAIRRV